jgi:hypothetical protein
VAERIPSGDCLRKIGGVKMSRDGIPFLERQCGPKRLLAISAAKPSGPVLAVRTRILIDQKKTMTSNDTADPAHQGQLRGCREVMKRKTDPRDVDGLGPILQRFDEIALLWCN